MKLFLALVAAAAVACGGTPFTEAEAPDDSGSGFGETGAAFVDAPANDGSQGLEVVIRFGGPDAAGQPEASTSQEASAPEGPEASLDAAPDHHLQICSTLPQNTAQCSSSNVSAQTPNEFLYLMWNVDHDGGGVWSCSAAVTPQACRCRETFNCACLAAQVDFAMLCQKAGAQASCSDALGGSGSSSSPIVTCSP